MRKVVRQVSELIRDKSKTFAEACDAIDNRGAEHAGEISWSKVIEDVFAANSGWREKTRKDYLTTSRNFLKLFDQPENSPRDARQVFRRYSDLFFGKCAPGVHSAGVTSIDWCCSWITPSHNLVLTPAGVSTTKSCVSD